MGTVVRREARPESAADVVVAALHREHFVPLVRLASMLLDDVGACEEVTQDAFVQLHLHWDRLRDPAKAPAWLRSAVLNGARSRLRRRQVAERHPADAQRSVESADAALLVSERHQTVLDALRELPQRQREALALRYYLDLSEVEIADAMGISTGSVKTHVHRGLAALSTRLEEER